MSIDKSLKSAATLARHRNVLRRNERIDRLEEEARWSEGDQPFGLPKVANRKTVIGGKTKKQKTDETADAAATEPDKAATTAPAKAATKDAPKK